MAHNFSTIASNSNYQSILDNALDEYRKKTGKDLRSDPYLPSLNWWLDATVNVLYAFSVTINSVSGGINVACPLAG
ncbi:hypothetical protein BC826DRAFT_1177766 [Russula brevipes]|nr:hypothetical protein BC826DRAFT_1177766 [Russula brevipes]